MDVQEHVSVELVTVDGLMMVRCAYEPCGISSIRVVAEIEGRRGGLLDSVSRPVERGRPRIAEVDGVGQEVAEVACQLHLVISRVKV